MLFGHKLDSNFSRIGQKMKSPSKIEHKKGKVGNSHYNYEAEQKQREKEEKKQNHSYLERF